MKINAYNVFEYTKDNGTIYYANFNGVMLGTVVENVNKGARDSYLIIGTSMAIPINEHPHNNTQFEQPGYFTTHEEAAEFHRLQVVQFIDKANKTTLKDNPIPTDDLKDFENFVEEIQSMNIETPYTINDLIRHYRERKIM